MILLSGSNEGHFTILGQRRWNGVNSNKVMVQGSRIYFRAAALTWRWHRSTSSNTRVFGQTTIYKSLAMMSVPGRDGGPITRLLDQGNIRLSPALSFNVLSKAFTSYWLVLFIVHLLSHKMKGTSKN